MKHRVKIIIPIYFIALTLLGCVPNQPETLNSISGDAVADANLMYENGNYKQAAQQYQLIIDAGVDDGIVFYNLANAYFKDGDLGKAIINYKRAQLRLPRDPDVEANLELARSQTRDQLEQERNGFVGFITYMLIGWSTLDEVAGVALGLWITLCVCVVILMIWRYQRRWFHWLMVILTISLIFCLLSMVIRMVDAQRAQGVIVDPSIEVRSGPGTSYLAEFTLHSGTEVRILEHRNEWSRISLPGNLQGWIPDEVVDEM